jgi:hypothetical protein
MENPGMYSKAGIPFTTHQDKQGAVEASIKRQALSMICLSMVEISLKVSGYKPDCAQDNFGVQKNPKGQKSYQENGLEFISVVSGGHKMIFSN